MKFDPLLFWKTLFFSLLAAYCWYYAPYGINETDGGFLTGLAWQLLNGKIMYADVVYVRPPLPVWLRALEMSLLPDTWAALGERWIFYGKVALYAWLGATVLTTGAQRWMLAVFGFVVSVHCYPAVAWHTVDGILFGALSIWCWTHWRTYSGVVVSGICMAACLLCKQSFYPMAAVWGLFVCFSPRRHGGTEVLSSAFGGLSPCLRASVAKKFDLPLAFLSFGLSLTLFLGYLYFNKTLSNFWQLTNSAASRGEALQHGFLDYLRIQPVLAVLSAGLLAPVVWWFWRGRNIKIAFTAWGLWLALLAASYAWTIDERQEFTVPFAHTRLLFCVAALWGGYRFRTQSWDLQQTSGYYALLGLSWCAAVSWGYNVPVLFALPWVFAALDISTLLFKQAFPGRRQAWLPIVALFVLLVLFRLGYEFVYRNGPRNAMTIPLGDIFPRLNGIYSNAETAALYRDLRDLADRYGPDFKTLPSFPQSNYLTVTRPPLPLDWVVTREMRGFKEQVIRSLRTQQPVLLIEKGYGGRLNTDPELQLTMECLLRGRIVEETAHFWVVVPLSP